LKPWPLAGPWKPHRLYPISGLKDSRSLPPTLIFSECQGDLLVTASEPVIIPGAGWDRLSFSDSGATMVNLIVTTMP